MVLNLIARSLMQAPCRASGMPAFAAAAGAMSSRLQGAFGDPTSQWPLVNYVQNRGAARRGKRIERARQARLNASKRRLAEASNPKVKPRKRTVKVDPAQFRFQTERQLDKTLPDIPADNVFFMEKYKRKRFSLEEILEFHRQSVHPDVLNQPDALVQATIELNLKMKIKKKRFIERIESTVCCPHTFRYEIRPRKIVALSKEPADQDAAREAGAIIAGGMDVVDQLKKSQLTHRDFDHVVCHTNMLLDFASVKGMKAQPYFPNKARGNFGDDLVALVKFFKDGLDYSLKVDPDEPECGYITCYFGKLDMPDEQLRENFIAVLNSVSRFKPMSLADDKQFVERINITTPATTESFYLKFWELTDEYEDPSKLGQEEEDEKEDQENKVKTTSG